jgi:uncharacterized protein YcnI
VQLKSKAILVCAIFATTLLSAPAANAHVSIYPGVSATGSSTASLTAGQSGYLNFRIGHGCTDETSTPNPITGLSMAGSVWSTHSFSVDVPVIAQGTGSTIPKAEYIPGWKTSVVKNLETGVYTVTWTAISADFDVPDAPEGGAGGKQYAEFGISVKWASAALGDVYFAAKQVCNVDMSTKPIVASKHKITFKGNSKGAFAQINVGKAKAGQTVTFYGEHGFSKNVAVAPNGVAKVWISRTKLTGITSQSKLLAVKSASEEILGFTGGTHSSRQIAVSWDVTDGSGADTVPDEVEHNTAPKVTVLAAS